MQKYLVFALFCSFQIKFLGLLFLFCDTEFHLTQASFELSILVKLALNSCYSCLSFLGAESINVAPLGPVLNYFFFLIQWSPVSSSFYFSCEPALYDEGCSLVAHWFVPPGPRPSAACRTGHLCGSAEVYFLFTQMNFLFHNDFRKWTLDSLEFSRTSYLSPALNHPPHHVHRHLTWQSHLIPPAVCSGISITRAAWVKMGHPTA